MSKHVRICDPRSDPHLRRAQTSAHVASRGEVSAFQAVDSSSRLPRRRWNPVESSTEPGNTADAARSVGCRRLDTRYDTSEDYTCDANTQTDSPRKSPKGGGMGPPGRILLKLAGAAVLEAKDTIAIYNKQKELSQCGQALYNLLCGIEYCLGIILYISGSIIHELSTLLIATVDRIITTAFRLLANFPWALTFVCASLIPGMQLVYDAWLHLPGEYAFFWTFMYVVWLSFVSLDYIDNPHHWNPLSYSWSWSQSSWADLMFWDWAVFWNVFGFGIAMYGLALDVFKSARLV